STSAASAAGKEFPSRSPPGRQLFPLDSSSSSSISSSSASFAQSFVPLANSVGGFAGMNAASSSGSGVSSRLPKANGSLPAGILTCSGRVAKFSTSVSASASAGFVASLSAASFAAAGVSNSAPLRLAGSGVLSATGALPSATPARANADFTIEISGSGGTKGFFNTPSAPT